MSQFLRLLPLLPNLTLAGVVDILVVAFLVYQALMVVRGTRAGHILLGIFMMVLLYALSVWAGLEALRAVMSFVVPLIGLGIVVLFQSEIRRTLARLGRKRWLGLGSGYRAPESVNEILMAVEVMAPQRVGAKIARLMRDTGVLRRGAARAMAVADGGVHDQPAADHGIDRRKRQNAEDAALRANV